MGMNMAPPITVFTILKNSREQVRVNLKEHLGHQLIDLRIYDAGGFPTKSGVNLQVSHLPALREAIDAAIIKAAELGLLMEDLVPTDLRPSARRGMRA
jgi:hypothetical protein